MSEIFAITSQLSDIIKRQASVVHEMASLPEGERLRFWHEQFLPLEAREQVLREELLVVGRRMSSTGIPLADLKQILSSRSRR
jgi:hypothetical protein